MSDIHEKNETVDAVSTEENADLRKKYLTIWSDDQLYGIPIAYVIQIIKCPEMTGVPNAVDYIAGVTNVRGKMVSVLDLRIRFGSAPGEITDKTCVVLTSIRDKQVGILVDCVNEVCTVEDHSIEPPPRISSDGDQQYFTGITKQEDRLVMLIDVTQLIDEGDYSVFS